MNSRERKKIAELERDIRRMKKDHEKTFEEFNGKRSLWKRFTDWLGSLFTRSSR